MRSTTLALIAILVAAAASAATYEARSEHYALNVTNGTAAAKVIVTDLDNNSPIISEEVPWVVGTPSTIDRDIGDLHFALRLTRATPYLTANLEVDRGEMEIDLIRTEWILAPRRAHIRAQGAMRVGGDVHAPKVVHRVEPAYSDEARRNRVSGIVILEVLIDATGHVTEVLPLKPLPYGLTAAAVDAVKQWTFEPATLAGKPVPVIFDLTVNFKLDTPPAQPVPY
jgi:TonB family protein